jgi:hypothetical protein
MADLSGGIQGGVGDAIPRDRHGGSKTVRIPRRASTARD